jgi:hypothetical protein
MDGYVFSLNARLVYQNLTRPGLTELLSLVITALAVAFAVLVFQQKSELQPKREGSDEGDQNANRMSASARFTALFKRPERRTASDVECGQSETDDREYSPLAKFVKAYGPARPMPRGPAHRAASISGAIGPK